MLSFVHVRRGVIAGAVAGLLVIGTAAAGDSSRGGWLPPLAEAGPAIALSFSVGVAPTGDVVLAWGDTLRSGTTTKRGGHSWDRPSLLGDSLMFASVALDDAGNAILTAFQSPGGGLRTVAFTRAAGSDTWTGPVVLSGAEYDAFVPPVLTVNGSGQAVAAWVGSEGDLLVLRASLRSRDGTWSPPQNLGYAGYLGNRPPSVAIDDNGDAVAVWARGPETAANVYAEVRPAGGDWQPADLLSSRGDGRLETKVVMNGRGDALAVWAELDQPEKATLYSARLAAGATSWSKPAPVPVSDGFDAAGAYDFFGGRLSVALDEAGNATLVAPTEQMQVEAATLPEGSDTWEGPVVIGDGGSGNYRHDGYCLTPQVGVGAQGGAVAIWGGAGLYAALRPPNSHTWEKPVRVASAPTCFGRVLAVDAAGNAVAAWNAGWQAGSQSLGRVDAAVLDVTPPVLERLVAPATARVRRRVRFSVDASDSWSKLARPPLWQFGDGTSARGLSVRHAYRRRGSYRLSVTAEDLAGNRATSTAVIRVRRRPRY
jgi:hypothetical protein